MDLSCPAPALPLACNWHMHDDWRCCHEPPANHLTSGHRCCCQLHTWQWGCAPAQGNMDHKRLGPGSKFYMPVEVRHPVPGPGPISIAGRDLAAARGSACLLSRPMNRRRLDLVLMHDRCLCQVNGGLFQAGDCHGTQGDSEYDGAIPARHPALMHACNSHSNTACSLCRARVQTKLPPPCSCSLTSL